MPLPIHPQQPAGIVDIAPFADARQHIVQLLILRAPIPNPIRRYQR